jgi:tetratricopeptide (TPR) repeat protein
MLPVIEKTLECCEKALEDACLSAEKIDKVILVGGSTRIPLVQDMISEFFDQDPCKSVNPDEIVAMGAAVQGGVLTGAIQEIVLLDVTPFSLGVETKGDKMSPIIIKDTTIPTKATKTFTTTEDRQTIVNVHILQGEGEKASECMSLGKFSLTDIPPAKAGAPRISVTFSINADGLFEITAEELGSRIKKDLSIVHTFKMDEKSDSSTSSSKRLRRRKRRIKREVISQVQHSEDALKPVARKIDETDVKQKTPPTEGFARSRKTTGVSKVDKSVVDNYAMFSAPYEELLSSLKTEEGKEEDSTFKIEQLTPALDKVTGAEENIKTAETEIDSFQKPPIEEIPKEYQKDEEIDLPDSRIAKETTKVVDQKSFEERKKEILLFDKISTKISTDEYDVLERANSFLSQNRSDKAAIIWYDKAIEVLIKFSEHYPDKIDNYKKLVDLYLAKKQPEEVKFQLDKIFQRNPDQLEFLIQKYDQLLQEFPNYLAARLDKINCLKLMKRYNDAINDLELIVSKHQDNDEFEDKLIDLYKEKISTGTDPSTEFKLIKIYVRRQKFDDAIKLLEKLTAVPQYSLRANKILGLCYWQKNMLNLAWQKFSELPINDEIKELIFRLAEAMENEGQLQNAREAFEKITRDDPEYKNVATKIKKIDYRLKLSIEEIERMKSKSDTRESRKEKKERKRFVIIEEINRGSMGIVYKAKDNALDEIVAIKVLNEALNSDPVAIDRFKREARAARRLSHPNIVRIHDLGENKGKKFISMEYIEGKDLKKILRTEGRIPEERFLHYVKQVCEALHYAHSLGIIHRDIKPANIIITENHRIKIADYGIAKIAQSADSTKLGVVMGTPLYMPPEQIEGKLTDGRSDIYSLGIVMYEMLNGTPPFTEGNIDYHHMHSKPPKMVDVNPRLEKIVMKCIEKNPDNRYQSAKELLEELEKD